MLGIWNGGTSLSGNEEGFWRRKYASTSKVANILQSILNMRVPRWSNGKALIKIRLFFLGGGDSYDRKIASKTQILKYVLKFNLLTKTFSAVKMKLFELHLSGTEIIFQLEAFL